MKRLIIAALVAVSCPASAAERLAGPYAADIDAPELHGRCPGERAAGVAARDALVRLLGDGRVSLTRIADDKYGGRVDASIRLPDGHDASAVLLKAGLARPWPHPKGCPRRFGAVGGRAEG